MTSSSLLESTTAMLARIKEEIIISTNLGIKCKKWAITHDAKISWATEKIQEARNEREEIEDLTEQLKQLTAWLDQGEVQVKSLKGSAPSELLISETSS